MGVFDDKKFEQLDWMTQMTETIESELNGLLARLPDKLELNDETLLQCVASYASIDSRSVVRGLLEQMSGVPRLDYEEEQVLVSCFKFEVTPELEIDARGVPNPVKGKVSLVKVVQTFEDERLQKLMGSRGISAINRINFNDTPPFERINEILSILGGECEAQMKNRSTRKKMGAIVDRLRAIFANNEWRIRDMGLADKVGLWIKGYIETGNLACLTNLCKLKVMTHNNMPIYSIQEEV
jgi:hypothetical protein